MKKFVAITVILCLAVLLSGFTSTQAMADPVWKSWKSNQNPVGHINWNQRFVNKGQKILFNDINIGDSIFFPKFYDENGFLKPHAFKRLTRGTIITIISHDESGKSIIVDKMKKHAKGDYEITIKKDDDEIVKRYLVDVIPEQGVVQLNW